MPITAPITAENQITVDTEELDGSPTIRTIDPYRGVVDAVRILKCKWDDYPQLCKELLGYWEIVGGVYHYHYPHPFPNDINLQYVTARAIESVKGIGKITAVADSTRVARYEHAEVTVKYCTPEITSQSGWSRKPDNSGNWRKESLKTCTQMVTLDRKGLIWNSDQKIITDTQMPSKPVKHFEWLYNIKTNRIPSELLIAADHCNEKEVYSPTLDWTFPEETLLFEEMNVDQSYQANGMALQEITLHFKINVHGWNYFPRSDKLNDDGSLFYDQIWGVTGTTGDVIKFFKPYDFSSYII
jgi:hypothetical protein